MLYVENYTSGINLEKELGWNGQRTNQEKLENGETEREQAVKCGEWIGEGGAVRMRGKQAIGPDDTPAEA